MNVLLGMLQTRLLLRMAVLHMLSMLVRLLEPVRLRLGLLVITVPITMVL